jgi:CheY-like chemotaxis protein
MHGVEAKPTALVVDDDPAIREVFVEILDDAGFTTIDFAHGQPALAVVEQRHFDLLLIDQWLPDLRRTRAPSGRLPPPCWARPMS